jgi:hypothetical protein
VDLLSLENCRDVVNAFSSVEVRSPMRALEDFRGWGIDKGGGQQLG